MNNRRKLILATSAALVAPHLVLAQDKLRRVAWFGVGRGNTPAYPPFLDEFRAGMREAGWTEGRNYALSLFLIDDTQEEAERLARQMLTTNPELIVVHGRDVATVHRIKPPCPVAFAFSGDPVDAGFVQSYARPGGNFTGVSFMSLDLVGKRVELLRELAPRVKRIAVLARPEHPGEHRERAATEEVAGKLGVTVVYVPIQTAGGLDGALQSIAQQKCDALIAFPDGVMLANSGRIAKFALEAKIATVSGWSQFADNGFLLSYGPVQKDGFRRLGSYADRILRGVQPSDLPVELPRTVELVVNAHTARTLGIKIPPSIKLRADKLIE
jgi:putative ABC transport system substrate-binding protein